MKKCFTINQFRSTEEIKSYHQLLTKNIYQAIEIFYPFELNDEGFHQYEKNIHELTIYQPEVVMHLPFGKKSDLCNLLDIDNVFQRMKDAISFASQYHVNKFTLHLGYLNNNNRDEMLKHIVKKLKDICDYAYPHYIMIENMPSSTEMGYSPYEIESIIKQVKKDNLKFILDTGHANVSEYAIEDYINKLYPYLMHIHVNDNNGVRDEHARIGLGNIDFKKVISLLNNYQELYCLEILYQNVDDLIKYADDLNNVNK